MANSNKTRSHTHLSSLASEAAIDTVVHSDDVKTMQPAFESDHGLTKENNEAEAPLESHHEVEIVPASSLPHWQRELAASRVGRQSRASSIISTRTRLTVQSDDARSVEIEAGGQSFRISRDGSRITNMTAPPPYPGPPLAELTEASDEEEEFESRRSSQGTLPNDMSDVEAENAQPNDKSLVPADVHTERTGTSQESDVIDLTHGLDQNSSRDGLDNLRRTQSVSSSLTSFEALPLSPADERDESSTSSVYNAGGRSQLAETTEVGINWDTGDEQAAEVSRYYTTIMRDVDRVHRKRLHERDSDMARLRELLDEKDRVYRQHLRERDYTVSVLKEQVQFKDRTINELKTRSYELEENEQLRLEKARNEVEDMWEKRWKEYEALLTEKTQWSTETVDR